MISWQKMNDGRYAACLMAEITAVPWFELYDTDLRRAQEMNQVFFTQMIASLHRTEQSAATLLWLSRPVADQMYQAELHFYLILRQIGEEHVVRQRLEAAKANLLLDFEENNYSIEFLDEAARSDFMHLRESICTDEVCGIGKKELFYSRMDGAILYYNDVPVPSVNQNLRSLVNTMAQHPGCAISMHLIPTRITTNECIYIDQARNYVNALATEIQFRQGIRLDNNTRKLMEAYDYYTAAEKEPVFYFHALVYAPVGIAGDLAGKLATAMEMEGKATAGALEVFPLPLVRFSLAQRFSVLPWLVSDELVYEQRERAFWDSPQAPQPMRRFRYLMTAQEVCGVFKVPLDDGRSLGFATNQIPASREKLGEGVIAESNFKLGRIQGMCRAGQAHAGIQLAEFTKHGLIVGTPGSGKTNFSLGLLLQFWQDFHIPFLAVEPTKTEYRSLIDAIPDLQVFTPGKNNVSPYIINPFLPPDNVTVETYTPSLMSAFKAAFTMPDPLPLIFQAAVNECYAEYGWKMNSRSSDPDVQPFGFYEFIKFFKHYIQKMGYVGELKSNMETAGVTRLVSLIEQNGNIYDTVNTIPLQDLLRYPTVIELNAISDKEQKSLIMAFLLILICTYTKNNVAGEGTLKNIMLIDEAHVLLSRQGGGGEFAGGQPSTVEALEDMIAEIRSYGAGIIIADQSPVKVGRGIIENTNVKVVFKLVEKENRNSIAAATNMGDAEYDLMGRLGVGEAFLHYGKLHSPLLIQTYDINEKARLEKVVSDAKIAEASTYWDSRPKLLIPYSECGYSVFCQDECSDSLRTDAEFLATRLVTRDLHKITDLVGFKQYLKQFDVYFQRLMAEHPNIACSGKLENCVRIKFLRKALLKKPYSFSRVEYRALLEHEYFLKR